MEFGQDSSRRLPTINAEAAAVAEESEHVDKKTRLGVASLHAIGAAKSDFAAVQILALLSGGSELPVSNSLFPDEDAGGRLQ
jgi:hypothetical protein